MWRIVKVTVGILSIVGSAAVVFGALLVRGGLRLGLPLCGIVATVVAVAAGCGGASDPADIDAAPGELIAFTAGDGIYVVTADGRKHWKVPGTDGLSGPKWAPDGDHLAAIDLSDSGKAYSVTLDGSEKSRLPADSSTTPAWAPDGKRLAAFDEETTSIRVVRIADGHIEVTLPKAPGNNPAWSPDGRAIAFQGDGTDDLLRIFLVGANGRGLRQLTSMPGGAEGEAMAAWSPDGKSIAFGSDRDGDWDVYTIRTDGTGLRQITNNSVADDSPSWSPDGSRLVFARTRRDDRTEIVVRALQSGKETIVATGGLDLGDLVFEPSWQPRKP
jgi:Tol biopolymer transport system component